MTMRIFRNSSSNGKSPHTQNDHSTVLLIYSKDVEDFFLRNFLLLICFFHAISSFNFFSSFYGRDKTSVKNRKCKVIYSYKENKDDELTLAVGDLIEVYEEVS